MISPVWDSTANAWKAPGSMTEDDFNTLANVPMVAAYRVGSAEAWLLRRAINTSSIILANLVIGENVVPEFVQQDCTPEKLSQAFDYRRQLRNVDAIFARVLGKE